MDAGYLDLPFDDWKKVGLTPGIDTWLDSDAREQAYIVGGTYFECEKVHYSNLIQQQRNSGKILFYFKPSEFLYLGMYKLAYVTSEELADEDLSKYMYYCMKGDIPPDAK